MKTAKKTIKAAGYRISDAGHWKDARGALIPVTLIQRFCGDGITTGGNRRQVGRRIKAFARTIS